MKRFSAVSKALKLGALKSAAPTLARAFATTTPGDAVKYIKDHKAEMLDLRFTDFHGQWHHVQIPVNKIDEGFFKGGHGFDGSSMRGWQPIENSDMTLLPDPTTVKMDPFAKYPTASVICDVWDPVEGKDYTRDPRNIAKKVTKYLRSTGIAHDARVGPEAEFFVFDSVNYKTTGSSASYQINSEESVETADKNHHTYKIRKKEGYFPVRPADSLEDLRTDIVRTLIAAGIPVEASHHEVGCAGQCEVNIVWAHLLEAGDRLQWFKYIVKNVAHKWGKMVTFMPKPITDDNGSGMHCHYSLHKPDGTNLFTGDKYGGLSQDALYFIGGLIKHAGAVAAFTNPTVNSYRRLVPGFEAPTIMTYSNRNRSASIRLPVAPPKARRIEFRAPDPTANPYLAFSAILMAGLDGIQNKIDPGKPADIDLYEVSLAELDKLGIKVLPGSLEASLDALEADHQFLLKGGVFTQDLIDMHLHRKRTYEVSVIRKLPTAKEFELYLDC